MATDEGAAGACDHGTEAGPHADPPFTPGAVAGAAAYAVGAVTTYVLAGDAFAGGIEDPLLLVVVEETPPWKTAGWAFYGAHLVPTDVPPVVGDGTVDVLASSGASPLLYLVPPLVLAAAGGVTGRVLATADDPRTVTKVGLTVVVGYFPLSILGAFLTTAAVSVPGGEGFAAGPSLPWAVVLAGLVYPAVFGVLGAALPRLEW